MERRSKTIISIALACLTFGVFVQVLWSDFTNFDDQHFVLENPQVRAGLTFEGLKYAFKTTRTANWHPLTWLSFMIDAQIYGVRPFGYHLTNLLLHIANTLLLFLLLVRMTASVWRSAFVSALFAVHPLHVESVAWVAERKDVLSTLFWLLTTLAYVSYVNAGKEDLKRQAKPYALMVVSYVLGLMTKPMLVTLPFTLLLLDYWPLRRYSREGEVKSAQDQGAGFHGRTLLPLVLEKVPLFALSALSSAVTYVTQQKEGAMASVELYPFVVRLENAVVSYAVYIWKSIVPLRLAVFYPHPGVSLPLWQPVAAAVVLVVITRFVVRSARNWPYLAVGWFWYLGTLVPVIGLVQVGSQALADRYTYVPLVGLFIIIAWGIPDILRRYLKDRCSVILIATAGMVLLALSILTWCQVGYWRNSLTLFTHAIMAVPNNALAHNQLGKALEEVGKLEDAEHHFRIAVRLNPVGADAHYNLGEILAKQGKFEQAVREYEEAIRLNPAHYAAHNNLGMALMELGRVDDAIEHFRRALEINPSSAEAQNNLANALVTGGEFEKAKQRYREAMRKNPADPTAHYNLGIVLAKEGKFEEAIREFNEAIRIKPDYALAYLNLGLVLAQQGNTRDAMEKFIRVLEIEPNHPEANNNLGIALATTGDLTAAERHFRAALKAKPSYAEARYNLGNVLAAQGRRTEALEEYSRAVRIKPDYAQAHFNMAVTLFYEGKYEKAWDSVHAAQRYGFSPDPSFLQALRAKCPEPVR